MMEPTQKKVPLCEIFHGKGCSFDFYAYICHVIDDVSFLYRSITVSGISDMIKYWTTFVGQELIKDVLLQSYVIRCC